MGHDSVHTLDLPLGNKTPDPSIVAMALAENRVIVSKDDDFVTAFLLRDAPPKLLLISTGNISNNALLSLVSAHLGRLIEGLEQYDFLELNLTAVVIHS